MNWLRKLRGGQRMVISYLVILPVVFGLVFNANVPDRIWIPAAILAFVWAIFVQLY